MKWTRSWKSSSMLPRLGLRRRRRMRPDAVHVTICLSLEIGLTTVTACVFRRLRTFALSAPKPACWISTTRSPDRISTR